MGDGEETKGRSKSVVRTVEMDNLSLDISSSRFSRDLLQRFRGSSEAGKGEAAAEDVELNLGLSLGGRFGVDMSSKPLVRSSSIASCLPLPRDDIEAAATAPAALARAASMPVGTEEEWRKRKELQSLRRLEAKRRRSEKLRNLRIESGSGGLSTEDREKSLSGPRRSSSSTRSLFRLSDLAGVGGARGSQASVESKAGSCSSVSDLESRPMAGSSSPGSMLSVQESGSQEGSCSSSAKSMDMEDMPCVFTKGDGPNGRRVDGILYKYGRGEEVRIMCVCHGTFHSPADFVRHAGATDIHNPLKHIVVNPNSSSML